MLDHFFSPDNLVSDLKASARALDLPEGSIEPIIRRVVESVLVWLNNRDIVTKSDLERVVSRELGKYSDDLRVLYENQNKFI